VRASNLTFRGKSTHAISKSSMIATVVVVALVAVVLAGLYYTYFFPAASSTTNSDVSIMNLTLLSGSPSTRSLNQSCQGDAIIEMEILNQSPSSIHISSIAISGSNLNQSASILDSVSNSCLTLAESNPVIQASSSLLLDGYVNMPLSFGASYKYLISFDNGQSINGTLIAQA